MLSIYLFILLLVALFLVLRRNPNKEIARLSIGYREKERR
jgi:multisubunit Na+/H+ antiporter MnhC subunit